MSGCTEFHDNTLQATLMVAIRNFEEQGSVTQNLRKRALKRIRVGETFSRNESKHYKFNKNFIFFQGRPPLPLSLLVKRLTVTVLYTEFPGIENIVNLA